MPLNCATPAHYALSCPASSPKNLNLRRQHSNKLPVLLLGCLNCADVRVSPRLHSPASRVYPIFQLSPDQALTPFGKYTICGHTPSCWGHTATRLPAPNTPHLCPSLYHCLCGTQQNPSLCSSSQSLGTLLIHPSLSLAAWVLSSLSSGLDRLPRLLKTEMEVTKRPNPASASHCKRLAFFRRH